MAIPTIFAKVQELEKKINQLSGIPTDNEDFGAMTQRLTAIESLLSNTDSSDKINSLESCVVSSKEILQAIESRVVAIESKFSTLPTTETIAQLVARIDVLESTLSQIPSGV